MFFCLKIYYGDTLIILTNHGTKYISVASVDDKAYFRTMRFASVSMCLNICMWVLVTKCTPTGIWGLVMLFDLLPLSWNVWAYLGLCFNTCIWCRPFSIATDHLPFLTHKFPFPWSSWLRLLPHTAHRSETVFMFLFCPNFTSWLLGHYGVLPWGGGQVLSRFWTFYPVPFWAVSCPRFPDFSFYLKNKFLVPADTEIQGKMYGQNINQSFCWKQASSCHPFPSHWGKM